MLRDPPGLDAPRAPRPLASHPSPSFARRSHAPLRSASTKRLSSRDRSFAPTNAGPWRSQSVARECARDLRHVAPSLPPERPRQALCRFAAPFCCRLCNASPKFAKLRASPQIALGPWSVRPSFHPQNNSGLDRQKGSAAAEPPPSVVISLRLPKVQRRCLAAAKFQPNGPAFWRRSKLRAPLQSPLPPRQGPGTTQTSVGGTTLDQWFLGCRLRGRDPGEYAQLNRQRFRRWHLQSPTR